MQKIKCRFCLSRDVIEYGIRRNKHTCKQRYKCQKCSRTFVMNDGFLNRRFSSEIITIALDLWTRGLSLRQVTEHLKQHHGTRVSHVTIMTWLRDYGELLKRHTDKMKPDVSGEWMADELVHFFNKHHNWLWNVMHKQKKFLLASQYAMFRYQQYADRVFEEAAEKGVPDMVQTDGLSNYPPAIKKTFGSSTRHEKHSSLKTKMNMNIVERLQGSCRDRIIVTRGFSNPKNAQKIWNAWCVYYNFVRPHSSLGMTPAEACGLPVLKGNKWEYLIREAVNS